MKKLRFSIYGRYELEVGRDNDAWVVHRVEGGKRRRADLVLPPDLPADQIARHLDDLLHELAGPGDEIRPLS